MYQFDSGGVLKGCELLGKHLKLFTDKVIHEGGDKPIEHTHTHGFDESASELLSSIRG